jgi:hypothetical protein
VLHPGHGRTGGAQRRHGPGAHVRL